MSLEGNLEDLGLGEILQIVSLSRKSGILSLRSKGRDAAIAFRQGLVVRASSSMFPQSLGELLTKKSVIDPTILRKAISLQQAEGFLERLGAILVKHFDVDPEILEEVVREQVETVVISLFEWTTGSYDFQVQNQVETVYDTRMDPLQFMLEQGVNPQYLAMEGARVQEEKRGAINRGSFGADGEIDYIHEGSDAHGGASRSRSQAKSPVVIVDDDGPTLQAIAAGLREDGYAVHDLARSEDALIKVDALIRAGEKPTILIDLIMPKMDGSGVLGGIELLELLYNNFKELSIIVMTDYHYADAETKVRDRGCAFIMKPRRAEIASPELLHAFLNELRAHISGAQAGGDLPARDDSFNLGDEMRLEIDDGENEPAATPDAGSAGSLTLLRGMLDELNNPDLQGGVLLLLLRFASEFMNRAIVFRVHDKVVSGVGQFGIADDQISGNDKVRSINFPLEAGTLFSNPARNGQPSIFRPELTPLNSHIFKQLGGGMPTEVFIGPIMSKSRLIGFLYGDNLPEEKPLEGTEILEIFLSQAGIAMEQGMPVLQGDQTP